MRTTFLISKISKIAILLYACILACLYIIFPPLKTVYSSAVILFSFMSEVDLNSFKHMDESLFCLSNTNCYIYGVKINEVSSCS